jgi:hypothetical protein
MVWLNIVTTLEDDLAAVRAAAPAALDRLTPTERAVVADGLVESAIDSVAARCLGYRGFAKLVRGGSAPEQALMKAFSSESQQRLSLVAAEMMATTLDLGTSTGIGDRGVHGSSVTSARSAARSRLAPSEIQRNIVARRSSASRGVMAGATTRGRHDTSVS